MSSTVQSFSSSSPAPTDSGGDAGMKRSANYFFGFLITFVALLLIFVGCGVGSRRRFAARRRGFLLGDPWSYGEEIDPTEPIFLEPTFDKGGGVWSAIMPLSVYVSRRTTGDHESQRSTSTTSTTPSRNLVRFPLPPSSWLPRARRKPMHEKEPDEEAPTETVQVAVMIAMPFRADKYMSDKGEENGPEEYEFGVAHVPWGGGEIPTSNI